MIKAAGLGIAMCNATEEVKKSADVITAYDNDHDGLAEYLKV
jgi:hydroxymethylpyrimidine pyrophosphatase-like HAD family hydrolase